MNPDPDPEKKARDYALWLLSRQAYPSMKLKRKLLSKGYTQETVEQVLHYCIDRGYLCDLSWSESFVRVQQAKKYGPSTIRQKLYMQGISKDLVDQVLQEVPKGLEQIKYLLETRYRNKNLEDSKERQKVIQSLLRRGYEYQEICEVFSSISHQDLL